MGARRSRLAAIIFIGVGLLLLVAVLAIEGYLVDISIAVGAFVFIIVASGIIPFAIGVVLQLVMGSRDVPPPLPWVLGIAIAGVAWLRPGFLGFTLDGLFSVLFAALVCGVFAEAGVRSVIAYQEGRRPQAPRPEA